MFTLFVVQSAAHGRLLRSNIVRSQAQVELQFTILMHFTEAMDRIHRLGQRRPVQAIKLVVEDSIESRIVQVSLDASFLGATPLLINWHSSKKRKVQWLMPPYHPMIQ